MKPRHFVLSILTAVMIVGVMAPAAAEAGNNIVVTLRGSISGLMDDPPIEGALCYEAELVNTKTDKTIGTGIDCLEDAALWDSDGNPAGPDIGFNSIALTRTTFFFFPQGTVVATGRTTVAPVFEGSPSATHIVGDITPHDPDVSNILSEYGTGRFTDKTGSVRLSGAVNMENFPEDIGFNCIFVIDLD